MAHVFSDDRCLSTGSEPIDMLLRGKHQTRILLQPINPGDQPTANARVVERLVETPKQASTAIDIDLTPDGLTANN